MMRRRTFMAAGLAVAAGPALMAPAQATTQPQSRLGAAWTSWKTAHLDETGRVVDRIQRRASHSEGQS